MYGKNNKKFTRMEKEVKNFKNKKEKQFSILKTSFHLLINYCNYRIIGIILWFLSFFQEMSLIIANHKSNVFLSDNVTLLDFTQLVKYLSN